MKLSKVWALISPPNSKGGSPPFELGVGRSQKTVKKQKKQNRTTELPDTRKESGSSVLPVPPVFPGLFHGTQNGLTTESCPAAVEGDRLLNAAAASSYRCSNFARPRPTPSLSIRAVFEHTVLPWPK